MWITPAAPIEGQQRGFGRSFEMDGAIGAVLDDPGATPAGYVEQGLASPARHRQACGVMEFRHVIDEFRRGTAFALTPVEHRREFGRVETFGILSDLNEFDFETAKERKSCEIGRSCDDDRVARIEHHATNQLDCLLGAVHDQQVIGGKGCPLTRQMRGDPFAQLPQARPRPILQGLVPVLL